MWCWCRWRKKVRIPLKTNTLKKQIEKAKEDIKKRNLSK